MAELIAARPGAASDEAGRARKRRFLVLYICSLSLLIVNIDSTALNVALPAIQRTFNASLSSLQWVTDAYVLIISILMLAAGSMGDRVGRRRVFRYGLVIFVVGSLACSLAPSVETLIGFRMLQAVGGSMLNPNALSIITHTFDDRRERARAIGLWSATYGIALSAGPVVGGLLVDSLGWRWVFWINVPIGAAALILTTIFVPESRAARPRRVDVPGQTVIVAALGSLTYAIIEGPTVGWASAEIIGLFAFAVAMITAFVAIELRVSEPLVEVRFFKSPPFSAAGIAATLCFFVMGGFLFVNTLYLQEIRRESALLAGLALLPATVFIARPVPGRRPHRRPPRAAHPPRRRWPHHGGRHGGPRAHRGELLLLAPHRGLLSDRNRHGLREPADHQHRGVGDARQPGRGRGRSGRLVTTGRRRARDRAARLAASRRLPYGPACSARRVPSSAQTVAALAAAGAGAPRLARSLHVRGANAVAGVVRQVFTDATHAGWWLCTAAGIVLAAVAFVSTGPRGREIAVRVLAGVDD